MTVQQHSVAVELCLAGELDIASCPRLVDEVDRLLGEQCRSLTLDLTAVTFMDAAALGTLVHINKQMIEQRGVLEIVCDGGQPRRLLAVAGMEAAFRLRPAQGPPATVKAVPDPLGQ